MSVCLYGNFNETKAAFFKMKNYILSKIRHIGPDRHEKVVKDEKRYLKCHGKECIQRDLKSPVYFDCYIDFSRPIHVCPFCTLEFCCQKGLNSHDSTNCHPSKIMKGNLPFAYDQTEDCFVKPYYYKTFDGSLKKHVDEFMVVCADGLHLIDKMPGRLPFLIQVHKGKIICDHSYSPRRGGVDYEAEFHQTMWDRTRNNALEHWIRTGEKKFREAQNDYAANQLTIRLIQGIEHSFIYKGSCFGGPKGFQECMIFAFNEVKNQSWPEKDSNGEICFSFSPFKVNGYEEHQRDVFVKFMEDMSTIGFGVFDDDQKGPKPEFQDKWDYIGRKLFSTALELAGDTDLMRRCDILRSRKNVTEFKICACPEHEHKHRPKDCPNQDPVILEEFEKLSAEFKKIYREHIKSTLEFKITRNLKSSYF